GFPNSRRRNDQAALPVTKRREKIDTARANRVGLRIFEHDPPLRKLGRQFFEIRRLFPVLRRLAFDREDIVKDESFLAIARKTEFAAKFLAGAQSIKINRRARNINVLRHRQEIQLRITQETE